MSFRLVPKSVTLNDLEKRILRYFTELVYVMSHVIVKQLHRFQNLLLKICDHIKMMCAIIHRLFGQNKPITQFDGRRCIDD